MIKIEQLKGGCTATIERNGVRQPVYVRMVVTKAELDSLETTGGTLVYTIDEEQIVEVGETAPVQITVTDTVVTAEIPSIEVQDTVAVEATVEETEAPKAVVKPAIVKPAPRTQAK
jgi:hypothetical protein